MIDLKTAQAQIERMMGLDFGPKGTEQRREVLRVLQTAATTAIAETAVTQWIDTPDQSKFPKPGQLRSLIQPLNESHFAKAGQARQACIACGGSGWVETRGINRFDGLEVSGSRECICRTNGTPVVADTDACSRCGGHGVYGGDATGQYAGPWKLCGCSAATRRQERDPVAVIEANVAREKLIRRFGEKPIKAMVRALETQDAYHGEF